MLGLPSGTEIKRQVPKTIIYERFPAEMVGNRKKSFEKDISKIVVVNEISSASVNIREGDEVKAIFAVLVEVKNKSYNEKNLSLISKIFGQRLLIILHYEEEYQLAIYQTKLLCSEWFAKGEKELRLEGLSLDGVWQSLVSQVSGIVPQNERTLDEEIALESERKKLRKQIEQLEVQARREQQSKKKYEIHNKVLEYKKKLEEM